MRKSTLCLLLLLIVCFKAQAADIWNEGQHYSLIRPTQPTNVAPGKVEVLEVFSYGCVYCNRFNPTIDKLKASLPKNAQMCYVPASFIPSEDWPMFQRAFYTAEALGLVEQTHNAMFDAVWKTGELAIADASTNRLKRPAPTIEDAARFYAARTGISKEKFLATANSFSVAVKMNRADQLVKDYPVLETPTIIVNGKYRLNSAVFGDSAQLIALVKWLVAKETH
jgi:thiol:disulfide interchange protein DsbA